MDKRGDNYLSFTYILLAPRNLTIMIVFLVFLEVLHENLMACFCKLQNQNYLIHIEVGGYNWQHDIVLPSQPWTKAYKLVFLEFLLSKPMIGVVFFKRGIQLFGSIVQ